MPITKNINNTKKVALDITRGLVRGLNQTAAFGAGQTSAATPVITGRLQASHRALGTVNVTRRGVETVWFTDVEYGPAVEFGRVDQPGRIPAGMYRIGADRTAQEGLQIIRKNLP